MADFTMELCEVVELSDDFGLLDYPIFDESYRDHLNVKIVQHFWNREIGAETISMFRQQLRKRMHEIMPYWNQHYLATQRVYDPLKTIDIKTVADSTGANALTGSGTNTSGSDAKSQGIMSSFPQTMLMPNGDYADTGQTGISNTTATGSSTETQNSTNSGNVVSETSGYQGNPAILIAEYRATFVNTDMDIIGQLNDLFMGIWGLSDDYTTNGRSSFYGYYGYGFSF